MTASVPSSTHPAERRPRGRPRKSPEARDDGNRRQELIRAAAHLFRQQGFAATSTRDIAAAVGMRSGSPFYHFENKEALLAAVMLEGMQGALQRQNAALAGLPPNADVRERLRVLVRNHFDVLLGPDSDFIPVMLYEWRSLSAEQRQTITQIKDEYEAAWTPVLQALHDSGQLQAPVALARLMIFGALNWAVQWYQPTGQNLTPTGAKHSVKRSSQTAAKATGPSAPRASLDDLTEAALALFLRDPA